MVVGSLLPTRYDNIVEAMDGYCQNATQPRDIRPALVNVVIGFNVDSSGTRKQSMYW